jgi:EmrB/QacA subfamily drug resistance transporter
LIQTLMKFTTAEFFLATRLAHALNELASCEFPRVASVDVTGVSDPLDPSIWKIVAVTVIGSFLSQLNATIINVSLSSLANELHGSLATIQWVTSGYLLALTLALPLNGWLVDRIGAKDAYLWCFAAFTLSSMLCGLAWSADSLIGFRILQGMAGGLLAPMTQMMLTRAAGKHLTRVVGYAAVPILLAPLLGPIIAGAILKCASWRWLFLINLPVGALGMVLAVLFLPYDREHIRPRDFDWIGMAVLSPGLALFLYGTDHFGDAGGLVALIVSVLLLTIFGWTARLKGDIALIDIRLFGGRVFSTSAITQFLSNGVLLAGQVLIPIYLVGACGRSPSEMGWLMAPLGLGMMVAYPSMGALTKRFGIRGVSAGGALLALVGTLPFLFLASHRLNTLMLAPALLVRGAGLSAVGIPSLSAAYASVTRRDLPMATTALNIVQRLGGPTITTLCATLLSGMPDTQPLHQTVLNPYASVFLLLGALHVLLLASALMLPSR